MLEEAERGKGQKSLYLEFEIIYLCQKSVSLYICSGALGILFSF